MPSSEMERGRARNGVQRFLATWVRLGLTGLALLAQLVFFALLLVRGSQVTSWLDTALVLVSLVVLGIILNSRMQIEYKLAWTIPIMLAPLFGGTFYLLFGSRTGTRRQMERYHRIQRLAALDQQGAPGRVTARAGADDTLLPIPDRLAIGTDARCELAGAGSGGLSAAPDAPAGCRPGPGSGMADQPDDLAAAGEGESSSSPDLFMDPDAARQVNFLASQGPFLAYRGTQTTYYPVGEDAFEAMLAACERAENWIALEYFIVADGQMWRRLFDVLGRKARDGVRIWFMYDDLGSVWRLPARFIRDLTRTGIRVQPVNRFGPGLTLRYNNRDHRKMLVVDGVIGFTGGINIADEYINQWVRFGHWKDTSIGLWGPGAWGLATLFFTMWDLITGERTDLAELHPSPASLNAQPAGPGVVVSYDDTPFDDISLGWAAYRNLMSRADDRVDLMTPYLVPTGEMVGLFTTLAQSGVRVRVVTPGIPDKKYVFAVTRSNYRALVEAGVEVYEYTPGFLHAKQMVVDGHTAIIGTINFDFRSFYLHQENAVWLHRSAAIDDMVRDFEATIAVSRRVTLAEVRSTPWWRRASWLLLRTFSPLM